MKNIYRNCIKILFLLIIMTGITTASIEKNIESLNSIENVEMIDTVLNTKSISILIFSEDATEILMEEDVIMIYFEEDNEKITPFYYVKNEGFIRDCLNCDNVPKVITDAKYLKFATKYQETLREILKDKKISMVEKIKLLYLSKITQ